MGISPIACDIVFMFYFVYWELDPTVHENDDLFDILGVSQMHMFYVYDSMCWAWTLKHIIDEIFVLSASSEEHEYLMFVLSEKIWSTRVFDVCVEQESLEHMS